MGGIKMSLLLDFGSFRLPRTFKPAWTITLKTTSAWLTVFIFGASHFQTMALVLRIHDHQRDENPISHKPWSQQSYSHTPLCGWKRRNQWSDHSWYTARLSIGIRLHTINNHWTCTVIASAISSTRQTIVYHKDTVRFYLPFPSDYSRLASEWEGS